MYDRWQSSVLSPRPRVELCEGLLMLVLPIDELMKKNTLQEIGGSLAHSCVDEGL